MKRKGLGLVGEAKMNDLIQKMAELEEELKEALANPNIQKIKQIQQKKAQLTRQLKQQLTAEMEEKKQRKSREVRIGDTIYWVELTTKEKLDEQAVKEFLQQHKALDRFIIFTREYKLKKRKI